MLLALVNPETLYRHVKWAPIAGGIGIYDPNLATAGLNDLTKASHVLHILKDSTLSFPVDPVTVECKKSRATCVGYLLSGGLQTVTPWPFKLDNDTSLTHYIVKDAISYQIDIWDAPLKNINWTQDACKIYASDNNTAIQLCHSQYVGGGSKIVAGR